VVGGVKRVGVGGSGTIITGTRGTSGMAHGGRVGVRGSLRSGFTVATGKLPLVVDGEVVMVLEMEEELLFLLSRGGLVRLAIAAIR